MTRADGGVVVMVPQLTGQSHMAARRTMRCCRASSSGSPGSGAAPGGARR